MASTARAGAPARVARPPGWTPSAASTATCAGCGPPGPDRAGTGRAGIANPEIVWLVPAAGPAPDASPAPDANHGDGGVRAARYRRYCRYCRGAVPTGPLRATGDLADVSCAGCGAGPILSGALAAAGDLGTAGSGSFGAAIDTGLAAGGWRVSWAGRAGPWCPSCARAVHPRRAVRR